MFVAVYTIGEEEKAEFTTMRILQEFCEEHRGEERLTQIKQKNRMSNF